MFKRSSTAHKRHIAIIASPERVADAIDAAGHLQAAGCSITLHPKNNDLAPDSKLSRADAVLVLVTVDALRSKRVRQTIRAARRAGRHLFWIALESPAAGQLPASFAVIDGTSDLPTAVDTFLHALIPSQMSVSPQRRAFMAGCTSVFAVLVLAIILFAQGAPHQSGPKAENPVALVFDAQDDAPVKRAKHIVIEATAEAESTLEAEATTEIEATETVTPDSTSTPADDTSLMADFMPDAYEGDAPLSVTFENLSTGDIVAYNWDFDGDGVIDSTAMMPPTFVYAEPGSYEVTLTVTGADGEISQQYDYIDVYAPSSESDDNSIVNSGETLAAETNIPAAAFAVSPASGSAPLTVSFSNRSSGAIASYAWDFDSDGITDSTAQTPPPYTYTQPGEYRIALKVSGANGADTTTSTVTVSAAASTGAPAASFIVTPRTGNLPLRVSVTNSSHGDVMSYAWDFNGDGITDSTDKNPASYTYTQPGEYHLTLTLTGRSGGMNTTSQTIRAGNNTSAAVAPVAVFVPSVHFGNAPLNVTFTSRSTGTITGYAWDFNGDGRTDSTAQTPPAYTYTQPGDYTVMLKVSGAGGMSDTTTDIITVDGASVDAPVAGFQGRPLSGTVPLSVTFTGQSTGTITGYAWDFNGDGRTDSTQRNPPAYVYTQPGTYTVSLTVTGAGGSDITTDTVVVDAPDNPDAPEPPSAIFVATPITGTAPLNVAFNNLSDGDITTYAWDFNGDHVTDSTQRTPSAYIYTQAGTYTVTLTVSGAGVTDTATDIITVTAPAPVVPASAIFTLTPNTGVAPLVVNFNNQSTGDIVSYAWDFNGDGTPDSTQKTPPAYTFTLPGTYTVTLKATGKDGNVSTASANVIVSAPVIPAAAAFTVTPNTGVAPLLVNISNQSTGDIAAYAWDFNGDGTTDSTDALPAAYIYTDPGLYTLKLTVTGKNGIASTSTAQITVILPAEPVAAFTATPLTGEAPLTVTLLNTSTGDTLTSGWDFQGDGSIDSLDTTPAPFVYTTPGMYTLTLSARDRYGRINTTSVTITVIVPATPETVTPTSETPTPAPETATPIPTETAAATEASIEPTPEATAEPAAENTSA